MIEVDNLCQVTGTRMNRAYQKHNGQRTCVRCPWLIPSPRYLPNFKVLLRASLLIERQQGLAGHLGGDVATTRLHPHDRVFKRAEAADASLVWRDRRCPGIVLSRGDAARTGSREAVTALGTGRQNAVNQAS